MVGGDLGIANTCYLTISVAAPLIDKPPSWSGFDIKVQLPKRISLAAAEMSKLQSRNFKKILFLVPG